MRYSLTAIKRKTARGASKTRANAPEAPAVGEDFWKHARIVMIGQTSCQVTEGPLAGAVVTETSMLEWDGPKAKELSDYGVARKPGATQAFQHTDGTLEVTMTDGKPSGWTASGHGVVTLATGSWAPLNGKSYEWTGKGTGPNVFEADYTFK